MERIHHDKAEALRTKTLGDQMEARRTRNKALRERKALRLADKVGRPPPAPAFFSSKLLPRLARWYCGRRARAGSGVELSLCFDLMACFLRLNARRGKKGTSRAARRDCARNQSAADSGSEHIRSSPMSADGP
jgi:hypothetical protein